MKLLKLLLIIYFLSFGSLSYSVEAQHKCLETVIIDSTEYKITAEWCGLKLDSAAIADPMKLVQLPQYLTFEDYRIFLLQETRDAMVDMAAAAKKDSVFLIVDSGFRSVAFQERIIKRRLADGDLFETILKSVAPPGYSEHHSGRGVDLVPSEAIFANTSNYRWLKENAYKFGFYETYPNADNSDLPWEAWHWSYSR